MERGVREWASSGFFLIECVERKPAKPLPEKKKNKTKALKDLGR